MKKLFFVLCAMLTICTAVVPAFATEYIEDVPDTSTEVSTDVPEDVSDTSGEQSEDTGGGSSVVYVETPVETPENTKVTVIVPPDDNNGGTLSAVVSSIFGDYQRPQYQITEYDSLGNPVGTSYEYVNGLAGVDWPWLCGVVVFLVVLYSFLRLVGVVFKR